MVNIEASDLLICTPCQFLDPWQTTYTTKETGTPVLIVLVVFLRPALLVILDRLETNVSKIYLDIQERYAWVSILFVKFQDKELHSS